MRDRVHHRLSTRTAGALLWVVLASPTCADAQITAPGLSLTPAQMRDDINAFRTQVLGRDRSYAADARLKAESQLAGLEAGIDRVSPVQFALALARITALADNGHTNVASSVRARFFNRVPVRLTAFGDEFRVVRATEANADLLGARLVAVDGHAIAELRDSARTLSGGVPHWRDRFAPVLFESPQQLHAMGLARDPARATYAFQTLDGRAVQRQLGDDANKPTDARGGEPVALSCAHAWRRGKVARIAHGESGTVVALGRRRAVSMARGAGDRRHGRGASPDRERAGTTDRRVPHRDDAAH